MNLLKLILFCALPCILVACSSDDSFPQVSSVKLSSSSLELKEGETSQLRATFSPSNAEEPACQWRSTNTRVANVDNQGLVSAKAEGETLVIVSVIGLNVVDTCKVSVSQILPASISLNETSVELFIGEETSLQATVLPENAKNKSVVWTSSDETIATVSSNGIVQAVGIGPTDIIAKTKKGDCSARCMITVKPILVESVAFDKESIEIYEQETVKLAYTIMPSNATNKNVTFISSDPNVAKIDGNKVVGVLPGQANIEIITEDGNHSDHCKLVVKPIIDIEYNGYGEDVNW